MPGKLTASQMAGAINVSSSGTNAGDNGAGEILFVHRSAGVGRGNPSQSRSMTRNRPGPASPGMGGVVRVSPSTAKPLLY